MESKTLGRIVRFLPAAGVGGNAAVSSRKKETRRKSVFRATTREFMPRRGNWATAPTVNKSPPLVAVRRDARSIKRRDLTESPMICGNIPENARELVGGK